ncbi:MAG: AcvB/VirJ family lysyl-phosphatidylglycerol hydrolase [Bacteroidia bacterium]
MLFICIAGIFFSSCSKPSSIHGNNPKNEKIKLAEKDSVADLPLLEFPAQGNSDTMAIVLSGDGGWKTLVDKLANYFVSKNIATVGLDTKKDFWKEEKPRVFAKQLQRIYNYYSFKWHKKNIIFVGFSMGSDVLPFGVNRLPHAIKKKISGVVMIAPSQSTKFEIKLINYIFPYRDGARVLPEVKRLKKYPLFIICDDNSYSLSIVLKKTNLNYIELPGGHYFGDAYDKLNKTIGHFLNLEPY